MLCFAFVVSALPAVAQNGKGKGNHPHEIPARPPDPKGAPAKSPPRPTDAIRGKPVDSALKAAHAVDPVGMKVLVIAADGRESTFPAIKAFLAQVGVPYDVYQVIDANGTKTPLQASRLWDGGVNGYYQGIILTTDSLAYMASNGYVPSAFTPEEWNILWSYEAMFRIRQVTANATGFGPEAFGLSWPAWNDAGRRLTWQQTASTPVNGTLSTAGQQVFSDLNPSVAIKVTYADLVLATANAGAVPLVVTADGYALVSSYTNPTDGRESLAVTADGSPDLLHSLLLSYGVINWVTRGQFLGERHVYMNYQPDDICIPSDIWDPATRTDTSGKSYRLTGNDFVAVRTWQNAVRLQPTSAQFMLEWPFNGEGCASNVYGDTTLWSRMNQYQQNFKWISHTWDHSNLDWPVAPADLGDHTDPYYATAPFVTSELTQNHDWGKGKFTKYQKDSLVQPDISGLYNPNFYSAAYSFGLRYVISDTSRKPPKYPDDWSNPSPNAGFYAVAKMVNGVPVLTRSQQPQPAPALLVVPRYPTNLFYNLRTPDEWVSEYNCFYSKATGTCANREFVFWDNDLTYQQILDVESDWLLKYLLKWSVNPVMFHQANLGQYATGKSLLGDLVDRTLAKYSSMYKLPIMSPSQHDQGVKMADRMKYNASGITGQIIKCGTPNATPSITLKVTQTATIPLTGVASGSTTESYGGQTISYINVKPQTPVTIPLTCP